MDISEKGVILMTERRIQYDSFKRLRSLTSINVRHEVPLLGRIVDLVYIQAGLVITVEFKMHDWRRAILQARDHLLGADYAYICMPKRKISEQLQSAIKKAQVGLVFHKKQGDWPFDIVIEAPRSKDTWEIARRDLVNYVTQEANG